MRTKDYIEATYRTLREKRDVDAVLASLKRYLSTRGLTKLYPSVLRGVMEKCARAQKHGGVKVVVARRTDAKKHAGTIAEHFKTLGLEQDHEVIVDETIIGGFIIKTKDTRVDQSYKHKLLHAYRAVTD